MELKNIAKVREEYAAQATVLSRNLSKFITIKANSDNSHNEDYILTTDEWTKIYNQEKQIIGHSGLLNFPIRINGFNAIAGVIYANIKAITEKINAEQWIYILKGFLRDYTNNKDYIFPNILVIPPNEQIEYEAKHNVLFVKLIKPKLPEYLIDTNTLDIDDTESNYKV